MEESVYPKSCQRVTGERAWELKRGVTQIKDNMSLRGCTKKKKNNVRSWSLCSKNCFLKEKMRNDHMSFCFRVHNLKEDCWSAAFV